MRILRWVGWVALLIAVAMVAFAIYVAHTWDRDYAEVPLPNDVHVSTDPEVLARGTYLVYGPAHCIECHGAPDALEKLTNGTETPLSRLSYARATRTYLLRQVPISRAGSSSTRCPGRALIPT